MDRFVYRIAIGAIAVIASGLIMAAMVVFLGGLSYIALKDSGSQGVAILVTALGLIAAAVGIFVGGMVIGRTQQRAVSARPALDEKSLAAGVGKLVGDGVVDAIQANPRLSAIAALVAGVAVGASPDLRDTLRRML